MATIRPKLQRQEAFERHLEILRLLFGLQKNAMERAGLSDDPASIHAERLRTYDRFLKIFKGEIDGLQSALLYKQPNGVRNRNEYRDLAFDIVTDYFCTHQKCPKSRELIQLVAAKKPEISDARKDGSERFSERIARDVIRTFKAVITVDVDATIANE